MKKCGHYYVYIEDEPTSDLIHEVEAVSRFANLIIGENISIKLDEEGKALLYATNSGLLLIESNGLREVNSTGVYAVVTRKNGSYVKENELIGIVDLVPLWIQENHLKELEEKIRRFIPLIRVVESKKPRVALLITGTEIVEGRRKDLVKPIVEEKLRKYECVLGSVDYARDDLGEILSKLTALLENHDAVIVTGGMSVDPTDYTPQAIRQVASEVVVYGVPIKPTTMSMIAYRGSKAIMGVSSGIIHYPEWNILDIVLPWITAGVKIPREYIVSLGNGGLSEYFLSRYKKSLI